MMARIFLLNGGLSALSRPGNPLKQFMLAGLAFLGCGAVQSLAANPMKPFVVSYTIDSYYTNAVIDKFSRFELTSVNRFVHDAYDGSDHSLWDRLKELNPGMEIFPYQVSGQTYTTQDDWPWDVWDLNTIARYNKNVGWGARGHSQGDLLHDNNDFILRNSSGQFMFSEVFGELLLDFGNEDFVDYWMEATEADIFNQPWVADGVHADNVLVDSGHFPRAPGYLEYPVKYPNPTSWNAGKTDNTRWLQSKLAAKGQKLFANRGSTFTATGQTAWRDADLAVEGEFIAMEEGFVAVEWGPNDVHFYTASQWKTSVDTIYELENTRAALHSHTDLTDGESGFSTFGQPLDSWDVLYYGLGSYFLASGPTTDTYFYHRSGIHNYDQIAWYDEFEQLDALGDPTGKYTSFVQNGETIYMREFENGYVYVNPNEGGSSLATNRANGIVLPQGAKRITHDVINDDWDSLPDVTTFDLEANRAAIFFIPGLDGDYNGDGVVDAADYTVWRDGGSPDSSIAGYNLWRSNFGTVSPATAPATTVPEPTALAFAGLMISSLGAMRRTRRSAA